MATVLNFELPLPRRPGANWVDEDANRRAPALHGWTRDLGAVCEVLFATHDGAPSADRVRWVCAQTREFADAAGGKANLAFRASLLAVTWIAPLTIAKAPPLRRLRLKDRVRALKRYERSPLGLTVFALKAFTTISWFEHPESAREANFDGQCLKPHNAGRP